MINDVCLWVLMRPVDRVYGLVDTCSITYQCQGICLDNVDHVYIIYQQAIILTNHEYIIMAYHTITVLLL